MSDHRDSRDEADELRRLVARRLGCKPKDVACPRAKSDTTPCIARDGRLAVADAIGGDVCVGCDRRVSDLIGRERRGRAFLESIRDDDRGENDPEGRIDLGPCCCCRKSGPSVRNVVMLPRRAPVPGHGWGCLVCGLPPDGALAVVCDACLEARADPSEVVAGPVNEHGRAPIGSLAPDEFEHYMALHYMHD